MIWIDNIRQLQYYNQPKGVPCYCETLLTPSDILLQGSFAYAGTSYTVTLYVYSVDGLTQYEDATSKFNIYVAKNNITGGVYFNAQLNQWADSMCEHKCFIIRAVVVNVDGVTVFDKYTERYCQSDCCSEPSNITFEQDGEVSETGSEGISPTLSDLVTNCGERLIKIVTYDNCYNKFTGDYYATDGQVYEGAANFNFVRQTIIKGRIVKRPMEISRQISYNCKLQRVESTAVYFLEGLDFLPTWKMNELQLQLHSEFIMVEDEFGQRYYRFEGGTPLKKIDGAKDCVEIFKLEATLSDCRIRQVFGCTPDCNLTTYDDFDGVFIIPDNFTQGFYDESKSFAGNTLEDLIDYLRTLDGITRVEEIIISPPSPDPECQYYAAIGINGNGYIPTSIYYNCTAATNRVFSVSFEEASQICEFITNKCITPSISYVAADTDCVTPTITYEVAAVSPVDVDITGYGDWTIDPSSDADYLNNQVVFSIMVSNNTIIPSEEGGITFDAEIIGVIGADARPTSLKILNYTNNNLTEEQIITIDEFGIIRYTGEPTTYNIGENVEITFSGLVYNIP